MVVIKCLLWDSVMAIVLTEELMKTLTYYALII